MKYSGDPLNKFGCVRTEIAFAPPATIDFAIETGSDKVLIFPKEGEENFISVISVAWRFVFIE